MCCSNILDYLLKSTLFNSIAINLLIKISKIRSLQNKLRYFQSLKKLAIGSLNFESLEFG